MDWINRVLFVKMTAESFVKLFCCCCINQLIISLEAFLEEQLAYQDAKYLREVSDLSGWQPDETQIPLWKYCCTPHCCEPAERPPPTTESEVGSEFLTYVDENTRVSPLTAKIFMFYFSFCRRFTDSKTRLEAWENNLIRKTWVFKHNRTKTHRAIGQHLYIIQENQNQGSILDWSGNQMNYENDKILSAIALWCQQSKAVILLSVISEWPFVCVVQARITQLELEIKNTRNNMRATFWFNQSHFTLLCKTWTNQQFQPIKQRLPTSVRVLGVCVYTFSWFRFFIKCVCG